MNRTEREQAWRECYRQDVNAVREMILRRESDFDVVDDLTNQTFLIAWENLDRWKESSTFLTWVVGIAKNVVGHHLEKVMAEKRAKEVLEVYVEPEFDGGGYATPYYDRTDLSADVAAGTELQDPHYSAEGRDTWDVALEAMPRKMALAVCMRRDGHPNSEIARELGVSEKRVRNLVHESLRYFRDNPEINRTNSIYERDGEPPLRVRLSQSDVERDVRKRFDRRDSAFWKRKVREANPLASVAEWRELYK